VIKQVDAVEFWAFLVTMTRQSTAPNEFHFAFDPASV